MPADPRRTDIAAHIAAVAQRSASETDRLVGALVRRTWPGESADRRDPAAVGWLRRWRPARTGGALPPTCGCHPGACAVCNQARAASRPAGGLPPMAPEDVA